MTTTTREHLAEFCQLVAPLIRDGLLVEAAETLLVHGRIGLAASVNAFAFLSSVPEAPAYSAHVRALAAEAIEDPTLLGLLADACQDDGSRDCMELLDAVESCQWFCPGF